ncbi:hypothetical protein ACNOYE_29665 [Nannocystaceae bacterium ST9]
MSWPTRLLLALTLLMIGCAGRHAGPNYKSLDELSKCRPGECVDAKLEFIHWADSEHFRGRMPYYCDPGSELDGPPDRGVTRMIFVLHGVVGDNPESIAKLVVAPGLNQFRNVVAALRIAEKSDPELRAQAIAIIAPNFQRTDEWQPWTDEDKRAWTWTRSTWNKGTRSLLREARSGAIKADSVSSFDVFDEFLRAALIKFPALEQIVVVGHSTGAQAVHRYALLGVGVHERLASEGIAIRYVVANPGAYAFPLVRRKLPPGRSTVPPGEGPGNTLDWRWGVPKGCEGWDEWGYGLEHLDGNERAVRAVDFAIDTYLREADRKLARQGSREVGSREWDKAARQALILQYASREVWHMQASGDVEGTYGGDCPSTLQGRSRFERFSNFQEAWQTLLGVPAPGLHFVAIEGLDNQHSSRSVYGSAAGMHVLFE